MKEFINLNLNVFIIQDGEYLVAYCPAIELSAYADSVEKAKESFDLEVKIFIEETTKRGTLEKYLLQNGWRLQNIPQFNYEPPKTKLDKYPNLILSKQISFNQKVSIPIY